MNQAARSLEGMTAGLVCGGLDLSADRLGHPTNLREQLRILSGSQLLLGVGHSALRARVNLDDEAVGAAGGGSQGQGLYISALSRRMGGIDDNRQAASLLDYGHRGNIQGVPGSGFKGADALSQRTTL